VALLLAEERRQRLAEIVSQRGFVSLNDLVEATGASESTVRRDLDFLHDSGLIRRTHGGAASSGVERPNGGLPAFEDRRQNQADEKQRIGTAAAKLVKDGQTVLIDGGTTTFEVAKNLLGRSVQVFTNSLPIANLLSGSRDVELILIGGFVYPRTGVALGPYATATLEGLHVDHLFLGVAGLTERGLFNGNLLLVETERAMMRCAEETTVVADRTKFGQPGLAYLADWSKVRRVVTDAELPTELRKLPGENVEVVLASRGDAS
jgi:DeoR family transcriptional regulator, fructose operon transcriptional repressor